MPAVTATANCRAVRAAAAGSPRAGPARLPTRSGDRVVFHVFRGGSTTGGSEDGVSLPPPVSAPPPPPPSGLPGGGGATKPGHRTIGLDGRQGKRGGPVGSDQAAQCSDVR